MINCCNIQQAIAAISSTKPYSAVAVCVFVRQHAIEHITDDFHVGMGMGMGIGMGMGARATAGSNAVLVDDTKVTHAHVRRVVVMGKGEAVVAVEPAVIRVAAL